MAERPQPGRHLLDELLWVHDRIRHDLDICTELARRAADGLAADEVRAEIRSLQTNGPLWKLRVNCLYYCRFVHAHHNLEDVAIFPGLRAHDPALTPVVDRLEADHRSVSDQLDEVEAAADALLAEDAADPRARVVTALDELAAGLLAHLTYEEEAIGPTILEWDGWPLHG
jgi:Hemerythrin HHE cation binding domain